MLSSKLEISQLGKKEAFFFDLDGTTYLGNKLFENVVDMIELLKRKEKLFFFLSNNSSKSTNDYLLKLKNLGLNITQDNIILSQHPTIKYLIEKNFKNIFLMGTQSLKEEFKQSGFILTEEEPEILVLAFDQELTYQRLKKASKILLDGLPYIATHLDNRCPTEDGYIPDAGAIAALLEKTTGRIPRAFGKPSKEMILYKLEQLNLLTHQAIMFGDRLYTDIKMGINAGIDTCCVLSGETSLADISKSNYKPTFIINGIWDLYNSID